MQNQNRSILITGPFGSGKNTILGSIQVLATLEKFHVVCSSSLDEGVNNDSKVFDSKFSKWQESIDYTNLSFCRMPVE